MNIFFAPTIVSLGALFLVYWWGGLSALILALLLSVLEITLSFDNAVINARVLSQMSRRWQKHFLTWGMFFAVFGTRLTLPALIVGFSAMMSPILVAILAIKNPEEYARVLLGATPLISSFGGTFLLLVSLKYFFDVEKQTHWLKMIESRLSRWGRVEAIELALALGTVLTLSALSPSAQGPILFAGCVGVVLFVLMQGFVSVFQVEDALRKKKTTTAQTVATTGGFALFMYLNILDTAFSLDGVVGAFALTTAIPIIFVGLGIGSYFVRSITVYLVEKKTLSTLVYLEHGAHWAIFGLACSLFAGIFIEVPEIVTGLIGFVFVSMAYISSQRELQRVV